MLGTGEVCVINLCEQQRHGVGDILEQEFSAPNPWSHFLSHRPGVFLWSGTIKSKGRGPTLEEIRLDHAIRSSVAITKLPQGCDILKKIRAKKENRLLKNIISLIFKKNFLA